MRNHTQRDVFEWVRRTFGEKALNDRERSLRFIEEAIELVQALGLSPYDVRRVTDHVYARPEGDYPQEIGGVMITLEALAEFVGVNLDQQASLEWERINARAQAHFDAASERKQSAGICHIETS